MIQWTENEVDSLILISQESHISECAKILGRTIGSVRGKAEALSIRFKRKPLRSQFYAEDIAFMMELRVKNIDSSETAKLFKVSPKQIRDALKHAEKYGFDKYPKRVNSDTKEV